MIDVFSYGNGVQSTTILVLAAQDLIPKPDHLVFSDPQFEGSDSVEHLGHAKEYAAKHGMDRHAR